MGTEFYAVDKKNMRAFFLGKGWYDGHVLFDSVKRSSLVRMRSWVFDNRRNWCSDDEFDQDAKRSAESIAKKLWAFCNVANWNIEFRNDCNYYDDEQTVVDVDAYAVVFSCYDNDEFVVDDPNASEQKFWEDVYGFGVRLLDGKFGT